MYIFVNYRWLQREVTLRCPEVATPFSAILWVYAPWYVFIRLPQTYGFVIVYSGLRWVYSLPITRAELAKPNVRSWVGVGGLAVGVVFLGGGKAAYFWGSWLLLLELVGCE